MELHNGTIEVKSKKTRVLFIVTIPYKQSEIATVEEYPTLKIREETEKQEVMVLTESPVDDEADLSQEDHGLPSILIVEDSADVRLFLKTLLKKDFKIIEAENGQIGLFKAMKYVPELIISDVMMDVMDGFELCAHIKENLSTSHIPVILLTAMGGDEQRTIGFGMRGRCLYPETF